MIFFTLIAAVLSCIFGPSASKKDTCWTYGLFNPGLNCENEDRKCRNWCDVDGYAFMDQVGDEKEDCRNGSDEWWWLFFKLAAKQTITL